MASLIRFPDTCSEVMIAPVRNVLDGDRRRPEHRAAPPGPRATHPRPALGREDRGKRVLALVTHLDIRAVDADSGELLRELTLDPNRNYQPRSRPPGPRPKTA